jgi:hypothetical protein
MSATYSVVEEQAATHLRSGVAIRGGKFDSTALDWTAAVVVFKVAAEGRPGFTSKAVSASIARTEAGLGLALVPVSGLSCVVVRSEFTISAPFIPSARTKEPDARDTLDACCGIRPPIWLEADV